MITGALQTRRHYDFHGTGLTVGSADGAIAEAVDYRLREFAVPAISTEDFRIEFRVGAQEDRPGELGDDERRPVYDTPAGHVFYAAAADLLEAQFGHVNLRATLGRGLVRMWSERYDGADLYLAAHPLTMIVLSEMLKRRGLYSLHAACVAGRGRGVLIAGPSGTGKSTLVMSLVRAGLDFLSDDMVFLRRHEGAVEAYGFSDAIGVTQDTAARFRELADLAGVAPRPGFRKHLIRIEERFEAHPSDRCRPAYLIFPELTAGDSELEVMEARDAWLRLVPDVLLTHPASTQAHLAVIADLTKSVACYRLRSGPDTMRSAELIAALLG